MRRVFGTAYRQMARNDLLIVWLPDRVATIFPQRRTGAAKDGR